ncbi:hypothetical protein MSG28_011505 [Choristoneura fumiferana]|uniref:Uncharacterized protein n=1 Tax=Choristoneura fumiferana TaxID=7141 RepID=A0ACC0JNM6_CHOFU|nr:hypothetical protein MSG28_011505 [Choristoneura fumiferana]
MDSVSVSGGGTYGATGGHYGTYGHYGTAAYPAQPAYLVEPPPQVPQYDSASLEQIGRHYCVTSPRGEYAADAYGYQHYPAAYDTAPHQPPQFKDSQNGLSLGSAVHGGVGGREDGGGLQWRDPNLPEVIGFLNSPSDVVKANAAAYLQHLTYMDDPNKQKTRSLGVIWNMSSCEDLKQSIIDDAAQVIVNKVIIPHSGWHPTNPGDTYWSTVFRNASGVLRNASSAGEYARRRLRCLPGLAEALLHAVRAAIQCNAIGTKIVENCMSRNRRSPLRHQSAADAIVRTGEDTGQRVQGENLGCFGGSKKKKEGSSSSNSTSPLGKSDPDAQPQPLGDAAPNTQLGYSVPKGTEMLWSPEQGTSDDTIAAVLATLNEVIKKSGEFSRSLLEAVLMTMWSHAELREVYRKHGWREADFLTPARGAQPRASSNTSVAMGN